MVDIEPEEHENEVTGIPSEGITIVGETELINTIIEKHRQFLETYNSEFGSLDPTVSELKGLSSDEKRERDEINEHVAELKEKRQVLYHQAKQLRIEMFDLINVNQDAQKHEQEMRLLQKEVEALDWKLQTTVMGIQKEREIVDKIKTLSARIDEIREETGPVTESDEQVKQFSTQIKEMMEGAEECHKAIVSVADQSQEHHGSFVGYIEQLKGVRGRHIWLQSRIKSHGTALEHWENKLKKISERGDQDD